MKRFRNSRKGTSYLGAVMLTAMIFLPLATHAFHHTLPPPASSLALPVFTQQQQSLLYSTANEDSRQPNRKNKKTKGFKINPNLVGSISSDGVFTDRRKDKPARASSTGSLGKPTKPKKQKSSSSNSIMSKKDRQRTANGAVNSSLQTLIADPENEMIQVLEAKRGSKTVTIVRGMTSPMDDRKKLLKEMKRAIGVGGTLVDGVLEIQGPHSDKVLATLKKKGYAKSKKIGK